MHFKLESGHPRGSGEHNGIGGRPVMAEIGLIQIDMPKDRGGIFHPALGEEKQQRLNGVNQMALTPAAKRLMSGEIFAHLAKAHEAAHRRKTIARITNKAINEMNEWGNRPACEEMISSQHHKLIVVVIIPQVARGSVV